MTITILVIFINFSFFLYTILILFCLTSFFNLLYLLLYLFKGIRRWKFFINTNKFLLLSIVSLFIGNQLGVCISYIEVNKVREKVESYKDINGSYPKTLRDLEIKKSKVKYVLYDDGIYYIESSMDKTQYIAYSSENRVWRKIFD